MSKKAKVVVIGAGMGGLTAALRLARHGYGVTVLEARQGPGGLASGLILDGMDFDAGPYVLLDRSGLDWAFHTLDLKLGEHISLRRIQEVYTVESPHVAPVRILDSLAETAEGLERSWQGNGPRYSRFIASMESVYRRMEVLRWRARPGLRELLGSGAWRDLPFLLRPLSHQLARSCLAQPVRDAIGIWAHVSGQRPDVAPSPLAFVPMLIHEQGAYYPEGGIGIIPRTLESAGQSAGVEFRYGTKVKRVLCEGRVVQGVVTEGDEHIAADAVVSNIGGLGTYLGLVPETARGERERLGALPRQSPGVCAYLKVKGRPRPPYLRFHLPGEGGLCRLLITPEAISPGSGQSEWWPARLMAPMDYVDAEGGGEERQEAYLHRVLNETWWRQHIDDFQVLKTRTPSEWGVDYHLWGNSMNPVMTARLMRAGRLPHWSPRVRGLYLAGSSTHPGQWVSFCAISGIFAADCLRKDLP